jgi:hypothetical protein
MTTTTDETVEAMPTRDSIRAAILGTEHKPKSKVVDFFGQKIELRQGTLGDILEARESEDRQGAVIRVLTERAFIPGTDTQVFEETDAEVLKKLPFGPDFIRVSNALEELTDVNFQVPKAG